MGITRFNVGDILVGTDDENYAITNSHTLVQVLSVDYGERPRMEVIVIDIDDSGYVPEEYLGRVFAVSPRYFILVNPPHEMSFSQLLY